MTNISIRIRGRILPIAKLKLAYARRRERRRRDRYLQQVPYSCSWHSAA